MPWDGIDTPYAQTTVVEQKTFAPSKYQQAVFDFLATGEGHGVIEAVAGSGKSTTLVKAADFLMQADPNASVMFCAFNKSVVNELLPKLPRSTICKTINAIGHGALVRFLGKVELDDRKYKTIARDVVQDLGIEFRKREESRRCVDQLISFAQSTLVDTSSIEAMEDMAMRYNIDVPDDERGASPKDFFEIARLSLEAGIQMAREERVISFNDQIWLPAIFGCPPSGTDYLFVDECQDLSRAKLELILSMNAKRYLFVGDRKQSIYGFAGADPASFQNIIDRTNATVLPLSICYRCPKSHVALAQEIVPHIEAAPNAKEGTIARIDENEVVKTAKDNDLILCRFTAPLVRMCLQFIKNKRAARVKGRDIGESLAKMARDAFLRANKPYELFPEALEAYVEREVGKLAKRENTEGQIQAIKDKAECLIACYDNFTDCRTLTALEIAIQSIFADAGAGIELSSIHRAKGLEAETVFILHPDVMPFTWEKQAPWQFEQEENIEYVAKTRAKDTLYLVRSKSF